MNFIINLSQLFRSGHCEYVLPMSVLDVCDDNPPAMVTVRNSATGAERVFCPDEPVVDPLTDKLLGWRYAGNHNISLVLSVA